MQLLQLRQLLHLQLENLAGTPRLLLLLLMSKLLLQT
jgi:hypothetical protein